MSEGISNEVTADVSLPTPAGPYERTLSQLGRVELRCAGCGYGAISTTFPTQCPVCAGVDWDFTDWRPFSSAERAERDFLRDLSP